MTQWSRSHPRAYRWAFFVLGGVANTTFSYCIYFALYQLLPYQPAYFIAYVAGIVFSYAFNAMLVFHVPLSLKGLFSYPLVYVVQYVSAALLLGVSVERFHVPAVIAPIALAIIMLPVSYVLSKLLLNWSSKGRTCPERNV